jgi:hypothetical protein
VGEALAVLAHQALPALAVPALAVLALQARGERRPRASAAAAAVPELLSRRA